MTTRFIQCCKCGGTRGTLVKVGDEYAHMRPSDCVQHRAIEKAKLRRAEVLKQARLKVDNNPDSTRTEPKEQA